METSFIFLHALKFVAFGAAFIGISGFVVLRLWNWLVPQLFNGPIIKFKQALGLIALSFILFGGFRGHGPHHGWKNHQSFAMENHCQGIENQSKISK